VGWVGEGSGGKAGTSSCLHTLPLPSLGNATNTQFTKKKVTRFCLAHHQWTSLYSFKYCLNLRNFFIRREIFWYSNVLVILFVELFFFASMEQISRTSQNCPQSICHLPRIYNFKKLQKKNKKVITTFFFLRFWHRLRGKESIPKMSSKRIVLRTENALF